MQCEKVKNRLVEYVDGELSEPERTEVASHLDECDACRDQCQQLREGDRAIKQALSSLAPPGRYLTSARRKALEEAHADRRRPLKLISFRRFVAAAAIAAIIASAYVMYPDLKSFVAPSREPVSPGRIAAGSYEMAPLMVTSPGDGSELRVLPARVRTQMQSATGGTSRVASELNHAESVRMHPEWVVVPAENTYYDDSEAAYWW